MTVSVNPLKFHEHAETVLKQYEGHLVARLADLSSASNGEFDKAFAEKGIDKAIYMEILRAEVSVLQCIVDDLCMVFELSETVCRVEKPNLTVVK